MNNAIEENIINSAFTLLNAILNVLIAFASLNNFIALSNFINLNILREPLKNKVYFAGEIYDRFRQMGVPGAILSGYDSIDELLTDN